MVGGPVPRAGNLIRLLSRAVGQAALARYFEPNRGSPRVGDPAGEELARAGGAGRLLGVWGPPQRGPPGAHLP